MIWRRYTKHVFVLEGLLVCGLAGMGLWGSYEAARDPEYPAWAIISSFAFLCFYSVASTGRPGKKSTNQISPCLL